MLVDKLNWGEGTHMERMKPWGQPDSKTIYWICTSDFKVSAVFIIIKTINEFLLVLFCSLLEKKTQLF